MANEKILVVDDEKDIRDVVKLLLGKEGYSVAEASSGMQAIEMLRSQIVFDLVILDIIMPELSGVETAAQLRRISDTPILFLTAKSADADKIEAYSAGGDDYLSKPFSKVELLLRVNALLKRYKRENFRTALNCGVVIDVKNKSVLKNGQKVHMTEKEFELLAFLFEHSGKTFSISELYEQVWMEKFLQSSSNTVMVYIFNLRKKLEDNFSEPKLIQTIWGKGYCFVKET